MTLWYCYLTLIFADMIEDMNDYGVYADAMDIDFDEEMEDSNVEDEHRCRNLTDTERQQIYEALLERSNCGKLKKNSTNIVAQLFQVSRYKVRAVW
jgi:hypothetical protein